MAIVTNLKSMTPRREVYKTVISLLSGGYYDPKAFPEGKITVYPWDSSVDAWFTERLRLGRKEYVLWEAAQKVADFNGCSIDKMLLGDISTILMVSRSIRSNNVVRYTAVCPKCGKETKEEIKIPDELAKLAEKTSTYKGVETFELPESKDKVVVRLLNVGDEKLINERSDENRDQVSDHIAHIVMPIVEVGGGSPDSMVELLTWYNALSPKDSEFLEKEQVRRYPQLDTAIQHMCGATSEGKAVGGCGNKFVYDLDLNRDFFRAG